MTYQEMRKEQERLYNQVNWNSRESIHRYNEAVRELRKQLTRDEDDAHVYSGLCGKNSRK